MSNELVVNSELFCEVAQPADGGQYETTTVI
jgi:hypothetical protein